MAKKTVSDTGYQDWREIDQALRRIGEIDIDLGGMEGEMTLRVNEVRARYERKAEALKGERKKIEALVEAFARERKDEFTKVRSKELTFGSVSFRIIHKVAIRSRKATVAALEAMGLDVCLRVTKEPDKEAMKALDAGTLAKAGASLKTEDRFFAEPNMERIAGRGAVPAH